MTLRINVFGVEFVRLELDTVPEPSPPPPAVNKAVKWISRLWVKGMIE